MTVDELSGLRFFHAGERYLNGDLIDWEPVSYATMVCLEQVREKLHAPITLIRGAHPHQPTAIDACCLDVGLGQVAMALMRLGGCAWGVYSGNSFHVDTRVLEPGALPPRWMAVKIDQAHFLTERGLNTLEYSRKDGWIYLLWSHAKSFDALKLVIALAER